MKTDVIINLLQLSRSPRPDAWSATLDPLSVQLTDVEHRHTHQRIAHLSTADLLSQIDVRALSRRVVPVYLPVVGRLVDMGRDLRAALDSSFSDAVGAVRDATVATSVSSFSAAVERARRFIKLAESNAAGVDKLVARIEEAIEVLAGVDYVSTELVVPQREATAFYASSTGGAA